jgi:WXG100 family type VII secretion target
MKKENVIMDGFIKVDTQDLISTAEEFNVKGNQVKSITDNMISIIDSLKNLWEGEASITYNTKFHQLQDDMDKLYQKIQKDMKDLNDMAQQFIQAEITNIDTGNSLAGDVIS